MTASNFASVKLNRALVSEARREAELLQRSVGGQIEHWARLGRAIENAQGFSIERVREALRGELKLESLSLLEQDAVLDELGEMFDRPAAEVREGYAKLGGKAGAVGDDAQGRLVERKAGGLEPIG
ncbi:MAG: TA system antitoxin ParD family protein [Phenylobacterium sp.]|uniref:TA system antitoxin ParD family protein n=1 Tax=Phenylobacterium sp. TaxID=1871053 RepID=UPI00391A952C